MKKMIEMQVPVGSPNDFEMVTIKCRPITITGFEEFQFCIHRPIGRNDKLEYKQLKCGWIVASMPSGFKVPVSYDAETQEEAIKNAHATLMKHGKEATAYVFAKALAILKEKKQ